MTILPSGSPSRATRSPRIVERLGDIFAHPFRGDLVHAGVVKKG